MSSIAVTASATGTGVVTLAAPVTNTNRTINLPDSNGTIVTSATAGVPIGGPAFFAYTQTAQAIPTNTFTKIQFNAEAFDTASAYDSTTNYRFQPLVAGYYQVNTNVAGGGGSIGYCQIAIYKNGSQVVSGSGIPNNAVIGGMVTAATSLYLNGTSDYVEAWLWQSNNSTVNLQTSFGFNTFSGSMVRSAT